MKRITPEEAHEAAHRKGLVVAEEYTPGIPVLYGFVIRDRSDAEGRYIVINAEGATISGQYRGVASMIGPDGLGSNFQFYQLFNL